MTLRVAIMGSGGLGGMLGGLQQRAGLDVTFIARGGNLEALRAQGLTLQLQDEEFHLDVRATDDPAEVGTVDVVWFCVKTYDVEAAARQVLPLVGPKTVVLTLQNGVEAPEQVAAVVGAEHVLGGVNLGGATLVSPGVISAKAPRRQVMLGELNGGTSARVENLAEALADTGIDIIISPDIRAELWDKFVGVCMTLGLSALMRVPIGPILANPETAELALGVMREAVAVAGARGVRLPEGTPERWLSYLVDRVRELPTLAGSMYFDVINGRRLEIEAINGAAVRLGRQLGVPTPLNFAVYAGLLPVADGTTLPGSELTRLFRSAQVALLGAITDSLLGVCVDYQLGTIDIAFFVDGDLSPEDRETFQIVGTEVYAGFGTSATWIRERFIENAQQPLRGRGHWVFLRQGCRTAPTMDG